MKEEKQKDRKGAKQNRGKETVIRKGIIKKKRTIASYDIAEKSNRQKKNKAAICKEVDLLIGKKKKKVVHPSTSSSNRDEK